MIGLLLKAEMFASMDLINILSYARHSLDDQNIRGEILVGATVTLTTALLV
jgi:hypothetical protein